MFFRDISDIKVPPEAFGDELTGILNKKDLQLIIVVDPSGLYEVAARLPSFFAAHHAETGNPSAVQNYAVYFPSTAYHEIQNHLIGQCSVCKMFPANHLVDYRSGCDTPPHRKIGRRYELANSILSWTQTPAPGPRCVNFLLQTEDKETAIIDDVVKERPSQRRPDNDEKILLVGLYLSKMIRDRDMDGTSVMLLSNDCIQQIRCRHNFLATLNAEDILTMLG